LIKVHLQQVSIVDSVKLLNFKRIKLKTFAFYAKKAVGGASTPKNEKDFTM
jgi:hypothetical protein